MPIERLGLAICIFKWSVCHREATYLQCLMPTMALGHTAVKICFDMCHFKECVCTKCFVPVTLRKKLVFPETEWYRYSGIIIDSVILHRQPYMYIFDVCFVWFWNWYIVQLEERPTFWVMRGDVIVVSLRGVVSLRRLASCGGGLSLPSLMI